MRQRPERPVLLRFRQSLEGSLQCVRRLRCLDNRGGRRIWTDITSRLNLRPVGRCETCGCPLPAVEFVAQRCPRVVEPLCPKPGTDEIDAIQRKHRNEQMAHDSHSWCQTGRNPSSDLNDWNVASSSVSRSKGPSPLRSIQSDEYRFDETG